MTKHILFPVILVLIFIVLVGLYLNRFNSNKRSIPTSTPQALEKKEIFISNRKINVEIADTLNKRSNGLSNRDNLGTFEGMLFIFDTENIIPSFWMKDMRFPIDIIWIKNNHIIGIEKSVEIQANVPESKLKLYRPETTVDYVLEVNAGFCEKYKITIGDSVDLSKI